MSKNAWDCTLEIIVILGNIDHTNNELNKTNDIAERRRLSDKVDALELQLFELKDKLKNIDII